MYYDYDDWGDWRRPQQAMNSCYTGSPTATLGAATSPEAYGPTAVSPASFAPSYQNIFQPQFPNTFPYPFYYPVPVPVPYFKHSCHHHWWWW